MTTTSITPEVVGQDSAELLLDTDLTPTELARVESLETKLRMSDATVLEQKIIQGETLFRIQQERLYRSREPGERFTWEQPELCRYQMRPLLGKSPVRNPSQGGGFDLDGNWDAVIAIWKGANAKHLNPDRQAVSIARSTYEANQLRAGEDPGRMMSAAKRMALSNARDIQSANRAEAEPVRDYSPTPSPQPSAPAASSIPAWEIQKDDSSVDAGSECKRITQALNDAHKAIGTLRGILYSQTQRYGSDYLGFLRQVDAGVYSLNNIDDQVQQMSEDIQRIMDVLASDAEPGELAQSTVDVDSMPSRA